jgi:hypothetical protein
LTGKLYWRISIGSRAYTSDEAGRINHGYCHVKIDGKVYRVHRIIWKMATGQEPPELLDHINCDPLDNRISNLRPATHSQNAANSRSRRRGLKGVRFNPRRKSRPWKASINPSGKPIYLGYYATEQEAHEAYVAAAKYYFGDFANAG